MRYVGANLRVNEQRTISKRVSRLRSIVKDADRWAVFATEAHQYAGDLDALGQVFGGRWDGNRANRGRAECKVVVGPGVTVVQAKTVPLSPSVLGNSTAAKKFWHSRSCAVAVTDRREVLVSFHGNAVIQNKVTGRPLTNEGVAAYITGMQRLEKLLTDYVADGYAVTIGGDGNWRDRKGFAWKWAPRQVCKRAGLVHFDNDGVDFIASTLPLTNFHSIPKEEIKKIGGDHPWTVAETQDEQGGDMGTRDYRRADATAQWFAAGYPGSSIKPNVLVLHTTEGTSWPDYSGGASAPTYTAMPQGDGLSWRQHFPETMSARALRNESGGVETNTLNCIQVELVGTCAPGTRDKWVKAGHRQGVDFVYWPEASDALLQSLAHFIADLHKRRGLKLQAPKFLAYPASYGASPVRFSFAQWRRFYGICGHQHVPENSHGDPGALNIEKVLRYAVALAYPKAKGTRLEKQREVIEGALVELDKASPKRSRLHDMVAAIRAALKKGPTK